MKNKEQELQETIARLEAILDTLPFDVWYKDLSGKYLFINQSFEVYTERSRNEIIGKDDYEVFPEEEAEIYVASDQATLKGKVYGTYEADLHNGKFKEELKRPIFDRDGNLIGTAGFSRDITAKKLSDKALQKSEERLRTIFEKSQIGIGIYDSITGAAYHVNDRLAEILGRSKEEVLSLTWEQYSYPDDVMENLDKTKLLNTGLIDRFTLDKRLIRADGTIIWTNLIVTPFELDEYSNPCHLCMINDITAQKQAEEETVYLNYHDQLTGLYNRRFYDEELKRLDTQRNLPISLIMADVNGLKLTNDAFGHMEGDELLKRIANILKQECRADDIVARMGGDEFMLLLPKTSTSEADAIMSRIHTAIKNEKWGNVICSVSFGLGTKKSLEEEMEKIFIAAEDHMYRNKLTESRSMRYETIRLIRETLYQKNEKEQRHCERVSELCKSIGEALGLSERDIIELKTAGLLHDIGKIGIDERLLDKAGGLTSVEWEDMERHPEIGYHILGSVNEFATVAEYVLGHHERVDGKGYPRNLKAEEIPLQSKIIGIADAYNAMTSMRSYRNPLTKEQAVQEIRKNAGTQFDKEIAEVFLRIVLRAEGVEGSLTVNTEP